jgi:ribosomal protein L32
MKFIRKITLLLNKTSVDDFYFLIGPPPPSAMVLVGTDLHMPHLSIPYPKSDKYDDTLLDGFLWAVPKKRRSREKRLTRKHSANKNLSVKKLLMCANCGGPHEPGRLCRE